ncbi:hypothetical protein ACFL3V_02415 [Nanoarchaeota archaeon]
MMKNIMIAISILLLLFSFGCDDGGSIVLECTPPLIPKGDGCCMDADKNGVCDVDEALEAEPEDENVETKTEEKVEPAEVEEESEDEVEEEPVEEVVETKGTKEDAEKVAKLFVDNWKVKQYNVMYPLFTSALKSQKTASEFTAIMELDPFYKKLLSVELLGVKMIDDSNAELSIEAETNVQEIDIPAATLEFEDGAWKVNVFADVFTLDLYGAACSGYRYNKQYKMSDCAFDLAKKVKDDQYCSMSECHYVECLKALGKPAGMKQEADMCSDCIPVMKTTNTCIIDVAIKYDKISACDVIDDEKYSDKYCACYGRFAKEKGSRGYCDRIADVDNKDLCLKGFEGRYC